VLWNGVCSENFPVINGVRQGALLVPYCFAFTLMDDLLYALRLPGVGCFLGNWFVGALAYADDIVLMAPIATAMRQLMAVCDKFAVKYDRCGVMFNASKSKCIFRPRIAYVLQLRP